MTPKHAALRVIAKMALSDGKVSPEERQLLEELGQGATSEVGLDLQVMQCRRTMVLMDPKLQSLPVAENVLQALILEGTAHIVILHRTIARKFMRE